MRKNQVFSLSSMDGSALQLVSELGLQLSQRSRLTKDFLVKFLKQAASALSQLEQSSQKATAKKLEASFKPLTKAIIKHDLLQNRDKDVRLLLAICVSELFRVMAPEPPFHDQDLREIFKLIISTFEEIADTTSPYFSRRVKILEMIARCRFCLIFLDIDCDDLVLEMFNVLFSVVREDHQKSLINDIASIMIHILHEEASWQLIEVILQNLRKDGNRAAVAAFILKSCTEKLEPSVCRFLTSCILDRDAASCELKEFYHEIILKIFQCTPDVLLPVIPSLTQELLTDQIDVRIKAVNLIGKLFAFPQYHVAEKYPDLFTEFIKRFSDKSVEVRVGALQCAKAIYMANSSGREAHEIITAVEDRLLDFDDRVRTQAVIVASDILKSDLIIIPSKLVSQTTERLRDKKISVRKKALQKLVEVYQDYCNRCMESKVTYSEHFEQIPCKILMLCYDKDCKEFGLQNMESILANDLFPEHISAEERTLHWIHMFMHFGCLHLKALNSILNQKRRLQIEMQTYLAQRKADKGNCSGEMKKRINSIFVKMATCFPDPGKVEECLYKLDQMKDNNIFNSLARLLVEPRFVIAKTTRDKLLKIVGNAHPQIEFLSLLSSKCSYNIFSSENVHFILDYLSSNKIGNKQLEASSIKLLLAIVKIFPSLLKGSEETLVALLEENNLVNDMLIEVLAKAGPHISVELSNVYPVLERLCLEGTRYQAKISVSAIAALIRTSEQSFFSRLIVKLVNSLHEDCNVPTVLQSLGCISQCSASTFETQDKEITSHIFQKLFQVELPDNDLMPRSDKFGCSSSCTLKIYGLKALVRSFLPYKGNSCGRKIDDLLDILLNILRKSDPSVVLVSCASDVACIRLAAAKAILRLSRRWDLHINPEIFRLTIMMAKEDSSFVKMSFLNKTHKMLKERVLPIRFACAFALAATDCSKDLQSLALEHMEAFIKEKSQESQKCPTSAAQGAITDHPAYVVVYLIHVLAHDTGFPPVGCQHEELFAQFCSPLFFVLLALVDTGTVDDELDTVNEATLHLYSILRAISRAEDAADGQMTTKLHILAEMGMFIINVLSHGAASLSHAPGHILLPSSLYRISLPEKSGKANSQCLTKCYFEKDFLRRVFCKLKSNVSLEKSIKVFPKRGRKYHEDGIQSNPKKPKNVLSTTITRDAKITRLEDLERKEKCATPTDSGSVGLHECSNIRKQEKPTSTNCEGSLGKNQLLSSCDSASLKGSLAESDVLTHNVENPASSFKENVGASRKVTVETSRCSLTNHEDSCSLKEDEMLRESSKSLTWHCTKNITTTIGGIGTRQETTLNKKKGLVKAKKELTKSRDTLASEVTELNDETVGRTRRQHI